MTIFVTSKCLTWKAGFYFVQLIMASHYILKNSMCVRAPTP